MGLKTRWTCSLFWGTLTRRATFFSLLISCFAQPAAATWSIVAVDTETQEVVVASATCVLGYDLKELSPVIVVGKGGATAQAWGDWDGWRRQTIWTGLSAGWTAQEIVDELMTHQEIAHHQHGVAEAELRTSASQTGALTWEHASGVVGSFGTVVYAIQGNCLTGSPVVVMAETTLVNTPGDLPTKAMAAMEAARLMGGDGRCSCAPTDPTGCGSPPPVFEKTAHIGYLLVSRFGDSDDPLCNSAGCADGDYFMDFNLPFQSASDPDPVFQLQAMFDSARQDLIGRPDAIASTLSFTSDKGPGDEWVLRVELNDWQGVPLGQSVPTFTVEHAPESDQVTTIGAIDDLGDGSYEVTLTETGLLGVDVFLITADDGIRPVILPPRRATLDLLNLFADEFESGDLAAWSSVGP